jgi:hypothetical protein
VSCRRMRRCLPGAQQGVDVFVLLWVASALIQPSLFASADTAPQAQLASGPARRPPGRDAGWLRAALDHWHRHSHHYRGPRTCCRPPDGRCRSTNSDQNRASGRSRQVASCSSRSVSKAAAQRSRSSCRCVQPEDRHPNARRPAGASPSQLVPDARRGGHRPASRDTDRRRFARPVSLCLGPFRAPE